MLGAPADALRGGLVAAPAGLLSGHRGGQFVPQAAHSGPVREEGRYRPLRWLTCQMGLQDGKEVAVGGGLLSERG